MQLHNNTFLNMYFFYLSLLTSQNKILNCSKSSKQYQPNSVSSDIWGQYQAYPVCVSSFKVAMDKTNKQQMVLKTDIF